MNALTVRKASAVTRTLLDNGQSRSKQESRFHQFQCYVTLRFHVHQAETGPPASVLPGLFTPFYALLG